MKRLIRSLLHQSELKKFDLCSNHIKTGPSESKQIPINEPVPYSTDHCQTCNEHMCYSCSEFHVVRKCVVKTGIITELGEGVLRNLNLGEVIKIDLQNLKCICGKPLGRGSAICAACGMASCSQQCHKGWEKMGKCIFSQNFYSIPEGFTMRSILFDNIHRIQKSKAKQWILTNKSNTTMLCCYASGQHPYVFLQRGFRNYGTPNDQFLNIMEPTKRALDYYIHFERRCDCACQICKNIHPHSSTNCQAICYNFDLQYMKKQIMDSKNHKQCNCPCQFCQSGIIFNTHRFIDCMPFCQRSSYTQSKKSNYF